MNQKYIDTIIKHVSLLCPQIRKPKHSSSYYLTNILYVLSDVVKWSSLKITANLIDKKDFHYKSISRIHRLWAEKVCMKQHLMKYL